MNAHVKTVNLWILFEISKVLENCIKRKIYRVFSQNLILLGQTKEQKYRVASIRVVRDHTFLDSDFFWGHHRKRIGIHDRSGEDTLTSFGRNKT